MNLYISLNEKIMQELSKEGGPIYADCTKTFGLWNRETLAWLWSYHSTYFVDSKPHTFRCWGFDKSGWLFKNSIDFYEITNLLSKHGYIFTIKDNCIMFSEESYFYLSLICKDAVLLLK